MKFIGLFNLLVFMNLLTLSIQADTGNLLATIALVETHPTSANPCAADKKIGKSGEVSRYQIMPSVWHKTAWRTNQNPFNPLDSKEVAEAILTTRVSVFVHRYQRQPNTQEIYVLWNKPAEAYSGYWKPRTRQRAIKFELEYLKLIMPGMVKKGIL